MGFKFVSAAILAAVLGSSAADAQSVSRIGGPANPPPAGFTGQQFVDNRGCVFLKAGYGGQTTWVPRVGRDRKVMCGFPPTGTVKAPLEVATAEEMAKPASQAMTEAAPAAARPVIASLDPVIPVTPVRRAPAVNLQPVAPRVVSVPTEQVVRPAPLVVAAAPRQPAPYTQAAPRGTYEAAQATGPSRGQVGCYTSAPVAERVKLRNGGTAVVCTRGDGGLSGWRPPVYAQGAGVGASLTDPVVSQGKIAHSGGHDVSGDGYGVQHTQTYARAKNDAVPNPPKGYKLAWKDDRLNPNRGKGTASGWAAQDQVWTRKVPAELVQDQPATKRKKKVIYVQAGTNTVLSTKGQPATAPVQKKVAKAAAGGAYIQVGTFGVPSNADGAAARLKNAGLPVARAKITSGGKAMQIVLAGPFGSAADAQTALSMARQAGFGDAFIR